jgi:hypothetical protein
MRMARYTNKFGGAEQEATAVMYEEVIRDFARRTKANLTAIECLRANGQEVYEVTQLVNSMLGLLVFPQQEFVDRIPETPLEQLRQDGWPVPEVRGHFRQVSDLRQLIRYLRNAVAHFNVYFLGDGERQIRVLRVWNENPSGKKTWEAELSVDDIRGIAERFIALLESQELWHR